MKIDYLPRDIYEFCDLFEDMLFMRTEKFLPDEPQDQKISLNRAGLQLLGNLGITGRIFRRWYQTTWGWNNPSRHFEGETPRMELAGCYQGLSSGDAYVGVQMLQDELNNVKIVPAFYDKSEIDRFGGVFAFGRSFLPSTNEARAKFNLLPAPNYDPGFKEFVAIAKEIEDDIERNKIEELPKNLEERAWRVFWSDACMTIPLNCELKLPRRDLVELGSVTQIILELAIKEQKNKQDNYIYIDQVVAAVWGMFRKFDKRLLSMEELTAENQKSISLIVNKANGPYSLNVFYNFNNLLDELLLFPADRYFGAVECVWTDKMNFINDLAATISLLNNNLKPLSLDTKLTKEQKIFYQHTKIEEKNADIYRIWFSPMTCFRILPRFLKYFN